MKFSELTSTLPPTVARALADRGYETATGVQAAVLDATHAGRDLLVSSQTGSGKTIAFGAALAQTLLGGEAPARAERGAPLALVVVPTRELAVQVRDELSWLLAGSGLRLASFTGGTAISGDLHALQRGVDLAIGTPGRLVDLMRRDRMSLGAVRVVVLDEADEMLDLGFREDLQTLLQAAPPERRTLLLSATMPPEIQAMAKRFQRDAVRVDVRRTDAATGKQSHGDITYVAHLIAGADRLAAVVNVLRANGDGRAIVFVTTRESVSRLHAALAARGFAATAISGERAQNERDRALEQLRKGEAQVLVATNVAARGLHLPDVDLIVHADLPLNAESLTHRSGRTGRAGRKGTAVVIAGLSERRKAERLLASAHVQFTWTPAPSADAITDAAKEKLVEALVASEGAPAGIGDPEATSEDGSDAPSDATSVKAAKAAAYRARKKAAAESLLQRLETTVEPRELALRLLVRELDRLPAGERVQPVAIPGPGAPRDEDRGPKPGRADFNRHGVLFRVNIGAKDNADPRWLLPLICRRGGVTRRDVGAIRIGPRETEFEIAPGAADDFALAAAERDPRAPHVFIEPAGRGGGRPSRPPETQNARPSRPPETRDVRPSRPPETREARPALRSVPAAAPAMAPRADAPVVKPPPASKAVAAPRPAKPIGVMPAPIPIPPAKPAKPTTPGSGPLIETKRARPLPPRPERPAPPGQPPPRQPPPTAAPIRSGANPHQKAGPPRFGRPSDGNMPPRRTPQGPKRTAGKFQPRASDGNSPPPRRPGPPQRKAPTATPERPPFWKNAGRKRPGPGSSHNPRS